MYNNNGNSINNRIGRYSSNTNNDSVKIKWRSVSHALQKINTHSHSLSLTHTQQPLSLSLSLLSPIFAHYANLFFFILYENKVTRIGSDCVVRESSSRNQLSHEIFKTLAFETFKRFNDLTIQTTVTWKANAETYLTKPALEIWTDWCLLRHGAL